MTSINKYLKEDTMEDPYKMHPCVLCRNHIYRHYMDERDDGFYCDRCAVLPPYSDELYNALVALQRLFRAHFSAKARTCGSCKKACLKSHTYFKDRAPICTDCLDDELQALQEERECPVCYDERCRCDDGSDWCEKCESPFGNCVCAEMNEEHERVHHCGDTTCDGNCGILPCGCIDICRYHHDEDDY